MRRSAGTAAPEAVKPPHIDLTLPSRSRLPRPLFFAVRPVPETSENRPMRQIKFFITALCGLAGLTGTANAQCIADSFEPNDTCATAIELLPGNYPGLTINGYAAVGGLKEDFYEMTVAPGEELMLDISWDNSGGQLQLWLYDDGVCTSGWVDAHTQSFNGTADVYYNNVTAAPVVLICKVRSPNPTTTCIDYDMNMSIGVNPCNSAPDDAYEDNDICTNSSVITAGTHTGFAVFGQGHLNGEDKDYYVVQGLPPGQIITIDVAYTQAQGDIGLGLLDGLCGNYETYSNYQGGSETISYTNFGVAAEDVYFEVVGYDQAYDCGTYDITITMMPDPCNSVPDDGFSPNHGCGSSATITPGTYTGLQVFYQYADYFSVTVGPNQRLDVEALFFHSAGNIDMTLYNPFCTSTIDTSASWTDDEAVSVTNATATPMTYYIEVLMPYDIPNCNGYDLVVDVYDNPCLTGGDDIYFPNFNCGSGPLLTPGLHPNLFTSKYIKDYFDLTVAPGATLNVTIDCISSAGNVVGYLYDPSVASCDQSSYLASATSTSDSKTLTFTNEEAVSRTYELELFIRDWDSNDCNSYSLLIAGALGQAATPFCLGDGTDGFCPCGNLAALGSGEGCQNSQGYGAILTAVGSNVVAADDMSFLITQARPNQPSMLIQGTAQVLIPFKDGILCMGNPTERVEVVFLDANGAGASSSSIVTEGGITAGMTRYYQQWYRDPNLSPCGLGSNFTQGLEVQWL